MCLGGDRSILGRGDGKTQGKRSKRCLAAVLPKQKPRRSWTSDGCERRCSAKTGRSGVRQTKIIFHEARNIKFSNGYCRTTFLQCCSIGAYPALQRRSRRSVGSGRIARKLYSPLIKRNSKTAS